MDLESYTSILAKLLAYNEFRLALTGFRWLMLVVCLLLVLLAIMHILYYLGHRTLMYQRTAPVHGWSRRFFVAVIVLLGALLALSWGIHLLLGQFSEVSATEY